MHKSSLLECKCGGLQKGHDLTSTPATLCYKKGQMTNLVVNCAVQRRMAHGGKANKNAQKLYKAVDLRNDN